MVFTCKKCRKVYYYDIKTCTFCSSELVEEKRKDLKVVGVTEVFVPSASHRQVPYFDVIAEDDKGNLHIVKSSRKYNMGDSLEAEGSREKKRVKVGIVGTGVTGVGIAENALMKGFDVILVSRTEERIRKITKEIETYLLKFMGEAEKEKLMKNYRPSADLNDLKDTGLVIESVVEDKKTKDGYFRRIGSIAKNAVIASNTSSLSIDELSKNLKDPSRAVGLHFFNPVPRMALVEVVKGKNTSKKALELAVSFAEQLDKVPVVVKDSPCFIVNRVLMPYLNEAAMVYEEGTASKEDIDKAAKLGLNHPMGPLALLDLIGLDVFLEIMNNLHDRTKNRKYLPAGIIKNMVKEGKLGRKTGEGFYKYN